MNKKMLRERINKKQKLKTERKIFRE